MSRDLAVPALLGLLLLLALPSTGLPGLGPSAPADFLICALLLTGLFALVGARGRPLVLLVAALPFVVYGMLETPAVAGTYPVPAPALWVVVICALIVPGLGPRRGSLLTAVLLTALAGGALLGEVPVSPTAWAGGAPERMLAEHGEVAERVGARLGAPVPVETTPLGTGGGVFLAPATRGEHPVDEPLYLVFGAGSSLAGRGRGSGTFLPGNEVRDLVSAIQLDAYDAAIVLPGAWPEGEGASARIAEALATFTRRGGMLVGPAPGRAWPTPLGQELGSAGRAWTTGPEGARSFGLGLVTRAASEREIREVLAVGEERVPVGTVFDRWDAPTPPLPQALRGWSDRPRERRSQGLLLLVYGVVAVLLELVLRGAVPRVMGLVAPALAVALGLAWTSPADPGLRTHAVAFELGGGGGRRLEALALSSGPAGWIGPCRFHEPGLVRLLGAHTGPDGLVRVRPGRTGWMIRETVAAGQGATKPEDRRAGFLRGLIHGEVDPSQLRFERGAPLPVRLGGPAPPVTWILRWR